MPKKIFESFFVIDANEKPAPSFLTAYIFTWLVFHNQTITTFIATDADFFTRLNMAIGAVGDNRYGAVFIITCVLVFGRFALNNSLYICREWLDNKTQGWLTKNGYKSFTSDKVHQQTLDEVTSIKAKLHLSQDREKAAADMVEALKNGRKDLKKETDTQLQNAENTIKEKDTQLLDAKHTIKEKEIEIDRHFKSIKDLYDKINKLETQNLALNEESLKSSHAFKQLQGLHSTLTEDHAKSNHRNNELTKEIIAQNQTIDNLTEELKG